MENVKNEPHKTKPSLVQKKTLKRANTQIQT